MLTPAPDIEIYVHNSNHLAILEWLQTRFPQSTAQARPAGKKQWRTLLHHNAQSIPVLIIEDSNTGFTSVWFNSTHTPWPNDIACAREAHHHFKTEVRATPSSWHEGDDPDLWWQITAAGEGPVQWPN